MIELRWKKYWYGDAVERQLQYRVQSYVIDDPEAPGTPIPRLEWSAWIDVPEDW